MLNVIILILKIIGIAIAAVLLLTLFVLLLVLFVPVRYRVKAVKDDDIQAEGRVSWLFGVILFKIKYTGEKTKYAFRIFGFKLFSDEPKVKKKVRKVQKTPNKRKSREQRELVAAQKEPVVRKEKAAAEPHPMAIEKAPDVQEAKQKKKTIWNRIREFFNKVKSIKRKIRDMLITIKKIFRKIRLVKSFLFDYKNRPGFRVVYEEARKLLRHMKPTKLTARVHFGMDDPCATGQILGAICAIYPEAMSKVTLIPDFDNKVLEGEADVRGRIQAAVVLRIILHVIMNKEFKIVWNEWKRLKEEL